MAFDLRYSLALCGILSVSAPHAAKGKEIDFARDVQPILSENCYACHGPDEAERSADLRLDTREGALSALTPGNPEASEMIHRILSSDPDDLMPPPDKKESLSAEEIEVLQAWITQGAEWGIHWGFIPPEKSAIPESIHPIDYFVERKLEEVDLNFSKQASRETLLRRAALDLTGLPPTLEELDSFLEDSSPDSFSKGVDVLLDSPHYGERWARWWMDAARYADSNGYEKDTVRHVWPYRDWLISSFNENLPYDQFVIKQVGGDLIENASLSDKVATGFLRNSMMNEEGAIKAEQFRVEGIFDRVDAIGKSIMGLTTQCAQCHTHKYDPITHDEYFGIFAYLNNAHEATVPFYTDSQQSKIRTIQAEIAEHKASLRNDHPEWKSQLAEWIEISKQQIDAELEWNVITPDHLGDGGQKFYPQPDGSIITKGYSPARSTERFATSTELNNIQSLRLELLMDPYLTYGGPGRSLEGSAALSELKLFAGNDPDKLTQVKFEPAQSDLDLPSRTTDTKKYPQRNGAEEDRTEGPAAFANDGDVKTAWATEAGPDRSNQPRLLIMNLEEPLKSENGQPLHLRFEIHCQHGGSNSDANHHRNLGRFRFSLGKEAFSQPDVISPQVRKIIAKEEGNWSEEEKEQLFDAWIATVPKYADAIAKIDAPRQNWPEPTPQLVMQEMEGEGRETKLFHRGEQIHPRHVVRPHVPAFTHSLPEGRDPESRLTFAHWLVDRESPTAARAFVNRTWQAFFGLGIVESVEDLGHQATAPSHPALLDWLAVEFMESGWDVKHLHRLIVTSRTYQQDSSLNDELGEVDPRNRLLARGARFRPDAEIVRDVQLASSGLLDRSIGGDSVRPPIPQFLFEPPASYGPKEWIEDTSPERRYRRAMYTFRFRTVPPPFLSAFDAPAGDISCVRRPRSTTPLQALVLLNEPLSVEAARALAEEMKSQSDDHASAIAEAFRQCTSRKPDDSEVAVLINLFEKEKQDGADPWLAVARVLLNLDETITKS